MRINSNKKNKKITDIVIKNIKRVPIVSYNFLVTFMKFCNKKIISIINNNAKIMINIEKFLKINKKIKERIRDNMPAKKNLFFIKLFILSLGILTFFLS